MQSKKVKINYEPEYCPDCGYELRETRRISGRTRCGSEETSVFGKRVCRVLFERAEEDAEYKDQIAEIDFDYLFCACCGAEMQGETFPGEVKECWNCQQFMKRV